MKGERWKNCIKWIAMYCDSEAWYLTSRLIKYILIMIWFQIHFLYWCCIRSVICDVCLMFENIWTITSSLNGSTILSSIIHGLSSSGWIVNSIQKRMCVMCNRGRISIVVHDDHWYRRESFSIIIRSIIVVWPSLINLIQ